MANVIFEYRSTKTPANLTLRFVHKVNNEFVSIRAQIDDTKSNCRIEKSTWTNYKKYTKGRIRDAEVIRALNPLDTELKSLEKHVLSASERANELTKDWLESTIKDYYNPPIQQEIPTSLIGYFDYYLDAKKDVVKPGTIQALKVVRNKVARFEKDMNRRYEVKDVNKAFMDDFIRWSKKMQYYNSVINKNFRDIKGVCRDAQQNEIEVSSVLFTLSTKLDDEDVNIIYLTPDELARINELEDLPKHLDNARDWLVISCYTGQRISDFKRFNSDMIRRENGRSFIDVKQQKTGKVAHIPLLPIVDEILKKREGKFPRPISNQNYNDYVKDVCRLAGLKELISGTITETIEIEGQELQRNTEGTFPKWRLISSKVGRRSFATNFYGKIPTSHLKDITAHSTESMLLKYIGKDPRDTANESFDMLMKLKQ